MKEHEDFLLYTNKPKSVPLNPKLSQVKQRLPGDILEMKLNPENG